MFFKMKNKLLKFQKELNLNTQKEKTRFILAFIFFFLYLEVTLILHMIFYSKFSTLLALFLCVLGLPLSFLMVFYASKIKVTPKEERINRKKNFLCFLYSFTVAYLVFSFWQLAFFPGSWSTDNSSQYNQAISGDFSNWHPVLHTLLFFFLPTRISKNLAVLINLQIIYFSLAIAYCMLVLYKRGYSKKFILASFFYIIANPNTCKIMLSLWKDCALTIFSLVLFTFVLQIFLSNGKWLDNYKNITLFSIFAFLTNGMRHNAILLVFPLFFVLIIYFKTFRKQIAISAGITLAFAMMFNHIAIPLMNVKKPDHRVTEVVGIPMIILSHIYMNNKNSLPKDTIELLENFATEDDWKEHYCVGDFNSVKFLHTEKYCKIDEYGLFKILSSTIDASLKNPKLSIYAFAKGTGLVWSYFGPYINEIYTYDFPNPPGVDYQHIPIFKYACKSYSYISRHSIMLYLFYYTGFIILFVIVLGLSKFRKFLFIVPLLIYDFGTMLLLSGYDCRFFHFNFLIIIPLVILLITEPRYDKI